MHTLPLPHCAAVVRLHISSRRPICIRTSPSLLLARRLLPIEHGSTFVRSTILALFSLVECVQDCRVYSRSREFRLYGAGEEGEEGLGGNAFSKTSTAACQSSRKFSCAQRINGLSSGFQSRGGCSIPPRNHPPPHPVMKPSPRPSSKDLQINGPVIEPVMARISVTVIRRDLGISKTSFSSDSFDSGTILPSFWLFTAASNFFLSFFFFQ